MSLAWCLEGDVHSCDSGSMDGSLSQSRTADYQERVMSVQMIHQLEILQQVDLTHYPRYLVEEKQTMQIWRTTRREIAAPHATGTSIHSRISALVRDEARIAGHFELGEQTLHANFSPQPVY